MATGLLVSTPPLDMMMLLVINGGCIRQEDASQSLLSYAGGCIHFNRQRAGFVCAPGDCKGLECEYVAGHQLFKRTCAARDQATTSRLETLAYIQEACTDCNALGSYGDQRQPTTRGGDQPCCDFIMVGNVWWHKGPTNVHKTRPKAQTRPASLGAKRW